MQISNAVLSFLSVGICVSLALLIMARTDRGPVHWAFAAALSALALAQVGNGLSLLAGSAHEVLKWRRMALIGETLMPIGWLVFSLSFARANAKDLLREWSGPLWGSCLLTVLFLGLIPSDRMFGLIAASDAGPFYVALGPSGQVYAGVYLIAQVLILANLEQTLRHADLETRWYIKFPIVGLGLLCVYFIYQTSDLLLYSLWHPELASLSGTVSGIACTLMGYGLLHRPIPDVQIYISRKVVSGSLTFMIVGGFLSMTGLTAWFLRYSGIPGGMIFSILFVLLAVTGLAFVLLSTHLRQALSRFAERNFFPHRYDYRTRWMEVTEALGAPGTPEQVAWRAVQLFKGIFGAKSISIWVDTGVEDGTWTRLGGYNVVGTLDRIKDSQETRAWLDTHNGQQDVSSDNGTLPEALRTVVQSTESVLIIPLKAGHRSIGWVTLGPHAKGSVYGQQDQDLLRCIAAQVADRLQHLVLSGRLMMAREMEAFYEYSTFFLHDLKNFTSTLSLVMQNAERHGGNPEFQQAAMRSVGATVKKMQAMMGTVSALSRDLSPKFVPVELNELVGDVLKRFHGVAGANLVFLPQPVPPVEADPDQLQQVLLNLILNAQEAAGAEGQITVRIEAEPQAVRLVVEDNGCGMDHATIDGLFRPFRTTKGRGLGIGLYQCQKIIHAHRGSLEVESKVGKGSRFDIRLRASQ